MARASKTRRGQRNQEADPEGQAPAAREEQPAEFESDAADASDERMPEPGVEEAAASPEVPLPDEGLGRPGTEEPLSAEDEPMLTDEPDQPGVAPDEPEIAETEPRPAPYQGEPDRAEPAPGRRSSRTWIAGGLILVLALAAIASAWFYGTYGEGQIGWVTAGRLDSVSQRVDEVATQVETQAGRVDAAERAVESARSDTGQMAERLSAAESSVQDLRSIAEQNRQTLDQMTAAVEQLRSAVTESGEGTGAGEAVGELRSTIESLAQRVQELEQGQGQDLSELTQTIGRLEQEIADLRSQAESEAQQAQQMGALSRAYAALSERVATGEPFSNELQAVATQLPDAPGLDVLRPLADEGVATHAELQAQLSQIANGLGGSEEPGEADTGGDLWSGFRERLQGAISIRRADEADWPTVLARADDALQTGDIETAVMEVEQASDEPPPDIEAWLAEAIQRRDAEAALEELSAVVLRQLAGQG